MVLLNPRYGVFQFVFIVCNGRVQVNLALRESIFAGLNDGPACLGGIVLVLVVEYPILEYSLSTRCE